jgi:hypothetical protein
MKKIILLLFLLISIINHSQTKITLEKNDKIVYLDSLFRENSTLDKKCYRIIKDYYLQKDEYEVAVYSENGTLHMKGIVLDKNNIIENGSYVYYYKNGNKFWSHKNRNHEFYGEVHFWYPDGHKKLEEVYLNSEKGKEHKIINYWDSNHIKTLINGTGELEINNQMVSTTKGNGTVFSKGKMVKSNKEGQWIGKIDLLKLTFLDNYKNDRLISGLIIDSLGQTQKYKSLIEKEIILKKAGKLDFRKQ